MYCIKNKQGQFAPDPGGDPKLFHSTEQAQRYIEELGAKVPGWQDGVASISPWLPNVLDLECLDHLRDIGFGFSVDGGELHVECDTLWNAPMVDTLTKYLKGGHKFHSSYRWFISFGTPRQVRVDFDDHNLVYPIMVSRRTLTGGIETDTLADWRFTCLPDLL